MGRIANRQEFTGATPWPGDLSTLEELARFVQLYLGCELALVSLPGSGAAVAGRADTLPLDELEAGRLSDPLLAQESGMRFYAGLPLRDAAGQRIGTLAAMDGAERAMSSDDLAMLRMLARAAVKLYAGRLPLAG